MTTILETKRLRLREIEPADLESLYALDSDPQVMRYIGDGTPSTMEKLEKGIPRVRAYYEKHPGFGIWLTELKENGQFLGWSALKYLDQTEMIEVGYRLMKAAWNQGYATEAAQSLIEYGWQQHNLQRIVAVTHPDNHASQRVLQKCGLVLEGSGKFYGGECLTFAINRPQF